MVFLYFFSVLYAKFICFKQDKTQKQFLNVKKNSKSSIFSNFRGHFLQDHVSLEKNFCNKHWTLGHDEQESGEKTRVRRQKSKRGGIP